jgi:hypothetical protein
MIKIEKLSDDARVLVVRNGKKTQIFTGQLISHNDWQTVEVVSGSVTYTVDELEVKTLFAPITDDNLKVASIEPETTKVVESTVTAVDTPVVKPKINMRNATSKK